MRLAALAMYGTKCSYCGIDDPIVLVIDHVHDDGYTERRINKLAPSQICSRIVKGTAEKSRYQVLCHNCNWRKEYLRRSNAQ